jgi:hypothetical protein
VKACDSLRLKTLLSAAKSADDDKRGFYKGGMGPKLDAKNRYFSGILAIFSKN